MSKLDQFKKYLKPGKIYRREQLMKWTTSVDRHLEELLHEGTLEKLSQGLYYYPRLSAFGKTPPDEQELLKGFLKTTRFLVTSPNLYNSLGVGTTQLYNQKTVYNTKRHGVFKLGTRKYHFHFKPDFPKSVTKEFLMVDLVNNLDTLAEDREQVLTRVAEKVSVLDKSKLSQAVGRYGNVATKKIFEPLLHLNM